MLFQKGQTAWNKLNLDEKKICKIYQKGEKSIIKLAKENNCSHNVIYNILKRNNIEIKGAKYFLKKKHNSLKTEFKEGIIPLHKGKSELNLSKDELKNLYLDKEFSIPDISKLKNCSYQIVKSRLNYYNIPLRTKSETIKIWHKRNNKTEAYEERCKKIKINSKKTKEFRKKEGKKYIYGCAKLSMENPERFSGENNPFYGKIHSKETLEILENKVYSKIRNKTYEEIYGEEKAKDIVKKREFKLRKYRNEIKNTEKEKERGRKISKTKRELIKKGLLNPMKGNTNPSQAELILKNIIEKNNLPFNHTGNGVIYFHGENHSFNPDFLSKNPKHIIEVFGDYWHNRKDAKLKDIERLATYSRYGYKTLILWAHELLNSGKRYGQTLTEEQIVNKIKEFIR